jgi:hypothetical protein
MLVILSEWDRMLDLARQRPYPHIEAERSRSAHQLGVEIGN